MRVGELRAILAGAPADAPATIIAPDGQRYELSRVYLMRERAVFFPARDLVARGPHVAISIGEAACQRSS